MVLALLFYIHYIHNKQMLAVIHFSTSFDKAFPFNIKQSLVFHFYEIIVNFNLHEKSGSVFW